MDKITKFLKRKLNAKESEIVESVIEKLLDSDHSHLDIKKLKGHTALFRARVGDVRIIFLRSNKDVEIIDIDRRDDNTYRDF